MSDSSRVERRRQEQIAEKGKEKAKPQDKKGDFEKLLEQQKFTPKSLTSNINQENATREGAREIIKKQEHKGDESKDKEKERGKDKGGGERKADAKVAEQRVVARGSLKDGRGSGGGGQGFQGGGYGGGQRGRKGTAAELVKAGAKGLPADLKSRFIQKLKSTMGQDPAKLSQEILNQLVAYVKIGINKKGKKEIMIDLHEKIYKGLKLKVTSEKDGKVSVHLLTANSKTRSVFKREQSSIKKALEDKGIEVDDIIIS